MKRDWKRKPEQCARCDKPFRAYGTKIADHPGTVLHRVDGYCNTCARVVERQNNEEERKNTSWWLSDAFMEYLAREYPTQYAYHMWRREEKRRKAEERKRKASA